MGAAKLVYVSTPPPTTGTVTLATIAAHLGISRSTVSNAYNHPDQLSPHLRERILETAARLGYHGPDPVARRLRQRRAGAIGVLFSEPLRNAFADPASVLFLEGVAQAGEEADSGMMLVPARPSVEAASVVQNALVDGFILYSMPPGHPFVDAALKRRVPVVCVDQIRIGGASWVGIDDEAAAGGAARHLLDLGHRRIGVVVYGLGPEAASDVSRAPAGASDGSAPIGSEPSPAPSVSRLRLDGYRQAFESAGVEWANVTIAECGHNTEHDAARAATSLLGRPQADRPTALLCTSDSLALGALGAARDAGLDVPGDLSIVGIDDLPQAEAAGLTTVHQPLLEKGRRAAELLLVPTGIDYILLEADLVIRRSTGPAPAT